MSDLVLIGSSAWVEATRKNGDPNLRDQIGELLSHKRAAMTGVVWVEVFQGLRGKREEREFDTARSLSRWLAFDDACWETAASVGRKCLQSGINVPFGDLLVFACARRYEIDLLEKDKHFGLIAEVLES